MVDQSIISPDAATVKQRLKTFFINGSVAGLTVLAVVFAVAKVRHFRGDGEAGAKVWFYDQSAKQLYPAPRDLMFGPPGSGESETPH